MSDSPGSKALRYGRFSQPGQIYLVTTVTHQRTPIFRNVRAARTVINAMRHYHVSGKAQTWCYVVMPDHLHWLVQLGESLKLAALVRSMKTYTAREINQRRRIQGRNVWQSGYHDHAVRQTENLRQLARYTIENPVRAGIVEDIKDYPHWDAWWFHPDRTQPMHASLSGLND